LCPTHYLVVATTGVALPSAREAVLRLSTLGIVSVVTLVATGIINILMLVGSVAALVGTDYGRLLLVKIALFLVMLAIAGVNRLLLTPQRALALEASVPSQNARAEGYTICANGDRGQN